MGNVKQRKRFKMTEILAGWLLITIFLLAKSPKGALLSFILWLIVTIGTCV